MVTFLLLLVFLALLSIGLWAYARVILTSAAADAARYVANANVSDDVVVAKAQQYLGTGLAAATRDSLHCHENTAGLLVGVTCTMRTPGIVGFLDGVFPDITVTGHSLKEQVNP